MIITINGEDIDIGHSIIYAQTNSITQAPQDKIKYRFSQQNNLFLAAFQAIATQLSALANNCQPKSITDTGGYFITDTVEGALQEIGSQLDGLDAALEALL